MIVLQNLDYDSPLRLWQKLYFDIKNCAGIDSVRKIFSENYLTANLLDRMREFQESDM